MAFKMKAGPEGPFRKNYPSVFKDNGKDNDDGYWSHAQDSQGKPNYAFRGLYDEGSHYGRWKNRKKDKQNLNYVPQSKQPRFQELDINEEYLERKRNSNHHPQSRIKTK
tara:strand:- start:337 stop:663 length:327 start_codon:yes stop_codon:yes gene_type:complete